MFPWLMSRSVSSEGQHWSLSKTVTPRCGRVPGDVELTLNRFPNS